MDKDRIVGSAKVAKGKITEAVGKAVGDAKSWEDAAQTAVSQANETLRNVRSIYIKNMEATVENGKIKTYRLNGKISFVLEG